jgi:DNA-binding NtrC family response regulator
MHGTILLYGNESMLVTTRALILESVGYRAFTANQFENAMLVLTNHQIDIVVLCQSLKDEERHGILETAHEVQPDIKCLILDFERSQAPPAGADFVHGMPGPATLLNTVGKLLTDKIHSTEV